MAAGRRQPRAPDGPSGRRPDLAEAWRADIGEGGGYRQKLLAQPVVAQDLVFAMDSDGVVSAFQLGNGARVWRTDSKARHVRSTNVGGGLAYDKGMLYAVNGLGEAVAFDPAKGTRALAQEFRRARPGPRPTVVEGRIFFVTIEDRLVVLATQDGRPLWDHRATNPVTQVLGQPAPAYANGLVVAGFGSGEIACLRADSGNLVWSDSLGSAVRAATLADFSSIRGRPVISNGQGVRHRHGRLALGLDLPTGRRLWEREVTGEDSPWVAGPWMFIVSDTPGDGGDQHRGRQRGLGHRRCRAGTDEKGTQGPDQLVGAGAAERPAGGDQHHRRSLALSPYTGAILGRQQLSSPAAPLEPVVAQGTLLVLTDAARLLALR